MPVRLATYADLVPASKCLAAAFKDEALFGQHMHPKRTQYPDDMYLHFLQIARNAYFKGPDSYVLVSYKRNEDATETITGLAQWQRFRSRPTQPSLYRSAIKCSVSWHNYLESFIWPNRAVDHKATSTLSRLAPFVTPFWKGSRAEVWDLTHLGVDSKHGGQGFGRELVKWGFEKAKAEGVGCSVIASADKEKFYQSCGFDVLAGNVRENGGMENPCNEFDIPGGSVLFWDNGRGV